MDNRTEPQKRDGGFRCVFVSLFGTSNYFDSETKLRTWCSYLSPRLQAAEEIKPPPHQGTMQVFSV